MSHGWDPSASTIPLPPQNGQVVTTYQRGVQDVRWDSPALLAGNSAFTVVGVNVYRSDVSDRGPYHRINEYPLGGTFFRDRTENVQIIKELVDWNTSWVYKGDAPNDLKWMFRTRMPISKRFPGGPYQTATAGNSPSDVVLYIDGVVVPVHDVFGPNGQVTLINQPSFNQATEKFEGPYLPTSTTQVEISYWTNRNHVRSGLDSNLFYRLTTVVLDASTPSGYRETPLEYCPVLTMNDVETMDYIWREAVRRNQWILQQGGERVKVFIRKQSGIPCSCGIDARIREYSKQPSSRCRDCYGSGFVGGYEGPYDVIVAPDDAERRISQGVTGRRKEHTYEVWMGPSPVVTQRDFIVKETNERYSIGPVRRPSNRGNRLQQHFNIAYLDEQDIRYDIPIDGTSGLPWPQTRYSQRIYPPLPVDGGLTPPQWAVPESPLYPEGASAQSPMETEKANTPDDVEQRGRTPVWENINYGILPFLLPLLWGVGHAVFGCL
jgi:hypothetical protein